MVDISEGVVEIGVNAFKDCFRIKEIIIPSTIKRINETAFNNARVLPIKLPEGLETLGRSVFVGATILLLFVFLLSSLHCNREYCMDVKIRFHLNFLRV